MTRLKDVLNDTLDESFEMPPQYGGRSYWRYNQVTAWIGLVAVPVLIVLQLIGQDSAFGRVALIFGFAVIGVASVFFILRDRKVQKRLDQTGLPFAEREPY